MTGSRSVRAVSVMFLAIGLIACAARPNQDVSGSQPRLQKADSLMLQRTRCFGYCPAYRVTLTANGRVTYQTSDPRDTASAITTSTDSSALRYLTARASASGFFDLPSEIAKDSELCPMRATDMPTAIVTIFTRDSTKSVTDYHGCFVGRDLSMPARLAKLRDLEAKIDSVLGTERFLKRAPAR